LLVEYFGFLLHFFSSLGPFFIFIIHHIFKQQQNVAVVVTPRIAARIVSIKIKKTFSAYHSAFRLSPSQYKNGTKVGERNFSYYD
jgi:hypothetical protein